jgi:hypothetical protein
MMHETFQSIVLHAKPYELWCTKAFSLKIISRESQCRIFLVHENVAPCGSARVDFIAAKWEGVNLMDLAHGK